MERVPKERQFEMRITNLNWFRACKATCASDKTIEDHTNGERFYIEVQDSTVPNPANHECGNQLYQQAG